MYQIILNVHLKDVDTFVTPTISQGIVSPHIFELIKRKKYMLPFIYSYHRATHQHAIMGLLAN
jgi:hypothetical protein